MGIISDALDAYRFKDTVFYKEDNDLQKRYDALLKLNEEYPDNDNLKDELFNVKKGLDGENEIAYQLSKSNIGMYVLRDVKLRFDDLTAQIDYLVVTPVSVYFIECKNITGNIVVNEKGDFIKEVTINGNKERSGIYSPLRQVEEQREVVRKIWESHVSKFEKMLESKIFNNSRRVLVVFTNKDTIVDTTDAPDNIKFKVLRADGLVRQLEYELEHADKNEFLFTQSDMENIAKSYMEVSNPHDNDYYTFYKIKYCDVSDSKSKLRERLVEFRKNRSVKMNFPLDYIFTNDELDKLLDVMPRNMEELVKANILPDIKLKVHGDKIVEEINKYY